MLEQILAASNGRLLVPAIFVLAGVFFVKGIFSLNRSKTADRRDFLDMWRQNQDRDDIWLEVSIRHLFGTYLPASLIRSLMQSPQAARALCEVSEVWGLLEMDDETLEVSWKSKRHDSAGKRRALRILLNVAYFVTMGLGFLFAYLALVIGGETTIVICFWIYALFLGGLGLVWLDKADKIAVAEVAAPRWLGLR